MLKICREQSPRKSMGFAELGLDMILAFKILCFGTVKTTVRGMRTLSIVWLPPLPKHWARHFIHAHHSLSDWFQSCHWACSCSSRWSGLAMHWAKLQKNKFLLWQVIGQILQKSFLQTVCMYHISSLTCCVSPRLKYLIAYLTFLLGSKSTRHLRFNMSNTKLKIFFPHPTCSSSNLSHLSRWHQLPPSCSGQKTSCYPWFFLFSLPHIQYISKSWWGTLHIATRMQPLPSPVLPSSSKPPPFSCLGYNDSFSSSFPILFLSPIIHSPHKPE